MDVSIIIVNYNTRDLLRNCITSIIEKTTGVDYEIIVVDNDSHDGSVEMLIKTFPDVRVINAGENLGFGKANNLGMQHASGDYFFFLNSDTILLNDAVSLFYRKSEKLASSKKNIGALGAILLDEDMSPCHSYGRFLSPRNDLRQTMARYLRFLKDSENTKPNIVKGYKEVDYVTGADLFISRKVVDTIGGFDPDYFMYCEEMDWQKRMKAKGYVSLIVEGPEIMHLEGGSDKNQKNYWSITRLINSDKSRKLYREKHYDKRVLPWLRALLFILDTPAIVLTATINRQKQYLELIKLK